MSIQNINILLGKTAHPVVVGDFCVILSNNVIGCNQELVHNGGFNMDRLEYGIIISSKKENGLI